MKDNLIKFILVFSFPGLLFSCKNNHKQSSTEQNDTCVQVVDIKSTDSIENYTYKIEEGISKDIYSFNQISTDCPDLFTENYVTIFSDDKGIVKIETTVSTEDIYKMQDYYFVNNQLIENYNYTEFYGEEDYSINERIIFINQNNIIGIEEKNGVGSNIDKAFMKFNANEASNPNLSSEDINSIIDKIEQLKNAKNENDLKLIFCQNAI